MTSTTRFNCFLICSNVISSLVTQMVIREIVSSSVVPTVRLCRLYDFPEKSPDTFANTPTWFSTYNAIQRFFMSRSISFLLFQDHFTHRIAAFYHWKHNLFGCYHKFEYHRCLLLSRPLQCRQNLFFLFNSLSGCPVALC